MLFPGVQSLDVTGALEVFVAADRCGPGRYTVTTAGVDGAPVRSSSGLRLLPDAVLGAAPDTLVVPGGDGTRHPDARLLGWLREHGARAGRIMSVCTGAFLLAEAGLLAGRRATTHWQYSAALARRFPDIDVHHQPIFVRDGTVSTSAGVTAGIDLALALVEDDIGRDAALTIARHLVLFLRRPGGQDQLSAQLAGQFAERESLREVQRWVVEHPGADLRVDALARRANLSSRQFSRSFTAETGMPPGRYVERVRVESARRLLEDTREGITEVARACGYGTPEAMRRAFIRALGVAPAEYRRRS